MHLPPPHTPSRIPTHPIASPLSVALDYHRVSVPMSPVLLPESAPLPGSARLSPAPEFTLFSTPENKDPTDGAGNNFFASPFSATGNETFRSLTSMFSPQKEDARPQPSTPTVTCLPPESLPASTPRIEVFQPTLTPSEGDKGPSVELRGSIFFDRFDRQEPAAIAESPSDSEDDFAGSSDFGAIGSTDGGSRPGTPDGMHFRTSVQRPDPFDALVKLLDGVQS
jgi:hypothetical protein